jgi:hypothetical protein
MLLVLLAFATASAAQTSAPAAPPAPAPAPAQARVASDPGPSSQDPRVCLEFPTREQVIACAEKFRPRRAEPKSAV